MGARSISVEELLTLRFALDGVQIGPQAGAFVPVHDSVNVGHDVQIIGSSQVNPTRARCKNVVVELQRVRTPLLRPSIRKPLTPTRVCSRFSHQLFGTASYAGICTASTPPGESFSMSRGKTVA